MKVLVTGAAGMLGTSFVPAFVMRGHQVQPTDIRFVGDRRFGAGVAAVGHLDVRRSDEVAEWMRGFGPDLVAHLGAETDLEACEKAPQHTYDVNTLGTDNIARACVAAGIPLIYVSTAGIFDGTKETPYVETDQPNPLNVYGHSKLEGEILVQALVDRHYIVRAGWMVGGGDVDHKFVSHIVNQVRTGARVLHAVGDKLGTPTYAPDFAACVAGLIDAEAELGIYHAACTGRATRYDVAAEILDVLGLEDAIELVEVDSSYFADSFPVPRPRSEIMRNAHLESQGLNRMRRWQNAIADYLATCFPELMPAVQTTETA